GGRRLPVRLSDREVPLCLLFSGGALQLVPRSGEGRILPAGNASRRGGGPLLGVWRCQWSRLHGNSSLSLRARAEPLARWTGGVERTGPPSDIGGPAGAGEHLRHFRQREPDRCGVRGG